MVLVCAITLFACEGNYKKIQQLSLKDNAPIAEGKNINLKYLDSGRVTVNLLAPISLDYTTMNVPYQEFPEGVEVRYWNSKNKKSTVTSDYAIRYTNSNLVDLRQNVVITTEEGDKLNAEQLYWDQKNKWVFTDVPYTIKFKDGSFNEGSGFDSNEDFTTFMSRNNQGVQLVDKKQNTDEI